MKQFHFSNFDHLKVLTHPDYPDTQVSVNPDYFENQEAWMEHGIKQFISATTEEAVSYIQMNTETLDYYDEAWMDGKLCRVDWSQGSKEGQEIVERMKAEFPEETIYDDSKPKNMISQYISDRSDYPNEIFHYYNFKEPTTAIKTRFGLDYDNYDAFGNIWEVWEELVSKTPGLNINDTGRGIQSIAGIEGAIQSWYAFKMDRVDKSVKCKIVIPKSEIHDDIETDINAALPEYMTVPTSTFFAKLHNADKSVSKEIDMYFRTNAWVVDVFCKEQGLKYPYGEYQERKDLEDRTHIWGVIYDTETKEFKHIKGYARFYR